MPICVAGMPHSGISTVGRALSALGVDLGPESEARFARINQAILEATGAAWDSPPAGNGSWTSQPEIESLKREARSTCDALALTEPWGWADSTNSLTLPFWRELIPDLEVLFCVRHPLELAKALQAEGAVSAAEALELWRAYYGTVDELKDSYVVTDVGRYADDSRRELERVARELHLSPSPAELGDATATMEGVPAGGSHSDAGLPREVGYLYERLSAGARRDVSDRAPGSLAEQKVEIAYLRRELERAKGRLDDLHGQVEAHAGWQREREELLANLEEHLLERDEDLKRAWEENEWRRGNESALRQENQWLHEKEHEARRQLESMQQTRLWRFGESYWSLKDRLRNAIRRPK
jgi:hypothetical protein